MLFWVPRMQNLQLLGFDLSADRGHELCIAPGWTHRQPPCYRIFWELLHRNVTLSQSPHHLHKMHHFQGGHGQGQRQRLQMSPISKNFKCDSFEKQTPNQAVLKHHKGAFTEIIGTSWQLLCIKNNFFQSQNPLNSWMWEDGRLLSHQPVALLLPHGLLTCKPCHSPGSQSCRAPSQTHPWL